MRVQVDLKSTIAIGDLAARFGLATHVLRHWEEMGLLTPARNSAGRRSYGPADVERVAAVLLAKDAGLALADIRDLLVAAGPERRAAFWAHREAVDAQIRTLAAAREMLDHAARCPADDWTTCPHFRAAVSRKAGLRLT
ncbi:MerR family transcriptional regulator [Asanoa iriomotensis]|uniref:MerR family transcriptional regulator n=1 Tax=Asanoa iriomotensis TaxID=234613 RepID=A0ABQ4C9U1_9ACTN|nr:MerR family transcriptional regulator [Asanoa iriomotensis]GIF59548.1 MerR family transcriptional regulator [Asanoa iriomotensis]